MKGMRKWRWAAAAAPLAVGVWIIAAWKPGGQPAKAPAVETAAEAPPENPHVGHGGGAPAGASLEGSLLDQMNGAGSGSGTGGKAETNAQLEQAFNTVIRNNERLSDLKDRVMAARQAGNADIEPQMNQGRALITQMNQQLAQLEQNLAAARQVRPKDPVVQWLTGELLLFVGGEPSEIRPYFEHAVEGGVDRPRAYAGLANVEYEADEFSMAYQTALKGLEKDPQNQYIWGAYAKAAFGLERFSEVLQRLDKTFPRQAPPWAQVIRAKAQDLAMQWNTEQAQRRAEARSNLPVVRFTIEHRRYVPGPDRSSPPKLEITGRGEVELELFEDQAPATVANFIHLVSEGYYNGTLFHLAESGLVVGGDPNTKNSDPQDDGSGGPGYTIPDEYANPGARETFRGSLCEVNTGPHTAGSQFFVTLVPHPEFNGHFTVFGRVIRGQEVLDQITPGRTNLRVGHMGKIIPGDVLLKAEVVRKRSHPYEVVKNRS